MRSSSISSAAATTTAFASAFFLISLSIFIGSSSTSNTCCNANSVSDFTASEWKFAYPNPKTQHQLSVGRIGASAILMNDSFIILGGCTNSVTCDNSHPNVTTEIAAVNALTGKPIADPASKLGLSSANLKKGAFAGKNVAIQIAQSIYLPHMCSVLIASKKKNNNNESEFFVENNNNNYEFGNASGLTPAELEFYKQTETITTSLTDPSFENVNISDFPRALANASCARNQEAIIVIGGVYLDKMESSDEIWVYDVTAGGGAGSAAWKKLVGAKTGAPIHLLKGPVSNAAVAYNAGSIFIISGRDKHGEISDACYRLVLLRIRAGVMCLTNMQSLPSKFLPNIPHHDNHHHDHHKNVIIDPVLHHDALVFNGGDILYFFSGSLKMAFLPTERQQTVGWVQTESVFPTETSPDVPEKNCTTVDTGFGGKLLGFAVMTNTSGSTLQIFRVGGINNVSCSVFYTTTSTTTTTSSSTTTVTSTTTTETSTTTSTTTEKPTTTTEKPTTATTGSPPPPPPSTTTAGLEMREGEEEKSLEFIRTTWTLEPSRLFYLARTQLRLPGFLVPEACSECHDNQNAGWQISPRPTFVINNSAVASHLIDFCNHPLNPCVWRISPQLSCADQDDATQVWNFNGEKNPHTGNSTLTGFVVPAGQFPLFVCFAASVPPLGSCDSQQVIGYRRQAFDVLNRLQPLSTLGDKPIITTTPTPTLSPGHNNKHSGDAPILSTGAIIGVVVAVMFFILVVIVSYSKKWSSRSQSSHSAAGIIRDSRYEYLEDLGEGSFGRVVRVRRRCDDEIFALKYIEIPTSKEMHDALNEFEITRQLQNFPNIITIHDMFLNFEVDHSSGGRRSTLSGRPKSLRNSNLDNNASGENSPLIQGGGAGYDRKNSKVGGSSFSAEGGGSSSLDKPKRVLCFVMDYHPDGDLKSWILDKYGEDDERVPEALLSHIALQMLRTLEFVHSKGVQHRDCKPENILIAANTALQPGQAAHPELFQKVVLTDFGLAKLLELHGDNVLFGGTAAYAAPEQLSYLEYHLTPHQHKELQKHLQMQQQQQLQQQNPELSGSARLVKMFSSSSAGMSPKEETNSSGNTPNKIHQKSASSGSGGNNRKSPSGSQNIPRSTNSSVDISNNNNNNNNNSSGNSRTINASATAAASAAAGGGSSGSNYGSSGGGGLLGREMSNHHSTPPEQAGAPADIFALASVLYACMTKKLTPTRGVREIGRELNRSLNNAENSEAAERAVYESISFELVTQLKYTEAFVHLLILMLQRDPKQRVTASAALQYFRKSSKDSTYYVSSRTVSSK